MNDYFQFPSNLSKHVCIWLHGLGASGEDMRMIAQSMQVEGMIIRHVFLDAPIRPVTINQGMNMPAWYDIVGTQLTDREDKAGIDESFNHICSTISTICQNGFSPQQIVLAGFSQGAAMALYTALNCEQPLGGVIALSGYLPLSTQLSPKQHTSLPMFIGYGRYDSIVMPAWTQATVSWLKEKKYSAVTVKDYPIDHSVCAEEVMSVSKWFMELASKASSGL
jgi:phospholipase/carboxylesterase